MLRDDTHYGEKILRVFEHRRFGRGRPASIAASVLLTTSEDAGHYNKSIIPHFTNVVTDVPVGQGRFQKVSRQPGRPRPVDECSKITRIMEK